MTYILVYTFGVCPLFDMHTESLESLVKWFYNFPEICVIGGLIRFRLYWMTIIHIVLTCNSFLHIILGV